MFAISLRPASRRWNTISFASTLYLRPVLDLLLSEVPMNFQPDLRLGLQEALVNAAKHGNNLDPSKTILVRFSVVCPQYWWVISDQGPGFTTSIPNCSRPHKCLPQEERECGRGLYILHQIFDLVQWNSQGTELRLCKQVNSRSRLPLLC